MNIRDQGGGPAETQTGSPGNSQALREVFRVKRKGILENDRAGEVTGILLCSLHRQRRHHQNLHFKILLLQTGESIGVERRQAGLRETGKRLLKRSGR